MPAPVSDDFNDRKWHARNLILACVLAAIAVLITSDVWRDMLNVSLKDEESSYILMVPVVIAILIWARRRSFTTARISHNWIGTVLIGLGWALWSAGYRNGSHAIWYGGADLMAFGCILVILAAVGALGG